MLFGGAFLGAHSGMPGLVLVKSANFAESECGGFFGVLVLV